MKIQLGSRTPAVAERLLAIIAMVCSATVQVFAYQAANVSNNDSAKTATHGLEVSYHGAPAGPEITVSGSQITLAALTCVSLSNRPMDANCIERQTNSKSAPLTAEEVRHLTQLIESSEFLNLEDGYGVPLGNRYYPRTISVKMPDGRGKSVTFRSGIAKGGTDAPEAFSAVQSALTALADERFSQGSASPRDSDSRSLVGARQHVAAGFVAGRVQDSRFFPFAPKDSVKWDKGPYTLDANLGQQATAPRFIDLSPHEGKSVFLSVAQLPQFYGVRVLGSCDLDLGKALWESSWDRGDFVLSLVDNVHKTASGSEITTDLPDPAGSLPRESPSNFAAGDVKGSIFSQFRKIRLNGGPLKITPSQGAYLDRDEGSSEPGADHLTLDAYEGKAVFFAYKNTAEWNYRKGDVRPHQAFTGVRILGGCDYKLGSALWAASTDRAELVLSGSRSTH